jgi:hypothetical protein
VPATPQSMAWPAKMKPPSSQSLARKVVQLCRRRGSVGLGQVTHVNLRKGVAGFGAGYGYAIGEKSGFGEDQT